MHSSPPLYNTTPAPPSINLTSTSSPPEGQFYFAYGSNLSTTQMLERCPSSARPLAVAKLTSYTWFICDRGYANILAVPPWEPTRDTNGSTVYGLVFWLTPNDEATLDGFEGFNLRRCGGVNPVAKEREWKPYLQGACSYNRFFLKVQVEKWLVPFPPSGSEGGDADIASSLFDTTSDKIELGGKIITVLVYVDEVRTLPGRIKDEYVTRLSRGALESIPYGIPESWFDTNMKRYGVQWWKGGMVKYDKEYSTLFMTAPPREEWEGLRERLLFEDIQGRETRRD